MVTTGFNPLVVHMWDGLSWIQLGGSFWYDEVNRWENPELKALVSYDFDDSGPEAPVLVLGGRFDNVTQGGVQTLVHGVAQWDGVRWTPIGEGLGDLKVEGLITFDSDGVGPLAPWLVAVGSRVFGPGPCAYAWNGTTWLDLGVYYSVRDVVIHDPDGQGENPEALAVATEAGVLLRIGGVWVPMGAPIFHTHTYVAPRLDALASWRQSSNDVAQLVVGGYFESAGGGVASANFARVACGFCYANCDSSSSDPVLSANDFVCFLTRFVSGDPYANCDGSLGQPALTAGDFHCFINAYTAGCP
jgi:hypothetical protein